MTGKDLVLVVLVAGTVGAGAAFAAGLVNAPAPATDPNADLASRLDRIETALARAADSQKESKESVSKLTERVTGLQMDVNSAREELKAAQSAEAAESAAEPARPGRAARPHVADLTGHPITTLSDGTLRIDGGDGAKAATFRVEGLDTEALRPQFEEARKRMQGLSTGLALRMLPEKDRWDKAKADLGLQDYQVENLKKAVADRDAAMKEAMNVESSTDGSASRITIRRMDPAKASAARADYDRKVTEALDSDQKKKWDEKGYGHAFGSPSGGGTSIAIVQTMDVHAGEEKDDGK